MSSGPAQSLHSSLKVHLNRILCLVQGWPHNERTKRDLFSIMGNTSGFRFPGSCQENAQFGLHIPSGGWGVERCLSGLIAIWFSNKMPFPQTALDSALPARHSHPMNSKACPSHSVILPQGFPKEVQGLFCWSVCENNCSIHEAINCMKHPIC